MRTRSLIVPGAVAAGLAAAAVILPATPAAAHVSITQTEQVAGAYTVLEFGVPHGCEDSPTTKVEIQIPESILNVTPGRSPFYDVEIVTEALPEPVEGPHGEEFTEREAVVVYTASGTPLPDGFRDELDISLQVPEDAAGQTLYFPAVQTCEEGEIGWIEIPEDGEDPHSLESPAPFITVIEAPDGHGHGGGDGEKDEASDHGDGGDDGEQASTDGDATEHDGVALDGELAAAADGDDTDGLTIVALVVGALGLLVGAAGFVTARKASS